MIGGSVENSPKKKVSIGFLLVALLVAFVVGNRLQTVGNYFFAPYNNHGNQDLSSTLDYKSVGQIYNLLKQKYDGKLDSSSLEDGLKKGLVDAAGDPYTEYMNAKDAQSFQNDLNGTFSGIGAELGKKNDSLVVIAPVDGSPAQSAGLKAGDVIVSIDGQDATKLSVDVAVDKIRGTAGTKVKLGLLRDSTAVTIEITRADITVPSVTSTILPGNIGYLKISRFSDDTADLTTKAATDFKEKHVTGVVLDLRDDGGGLLDAAVKVAGLWMDNQVVVSERTAGKTTSTLRTSRNAPLAGIPTAILINGGSASASEILAGALHDHKVATLVGEKSFGKGSVQELIDLDGGAKLKITVAHWYTPHGKNINKEGIQPDIKIGLTPEDFNNNRDPQKDRAISEVSR